jgi:hypothetical protein
MYRRSHHLPYVRLGGEWIEVDPKEIRQVLRFIKRGENGEILHRQGRIPQHSLGIKRNHAVNANRRCIGDHTIWLVSEGNGSR